MILDNFENWNLVWEHDYIAEIPAMINRYTAGFVIGEVLPPTSFTTNIISIQITNANRNSGYIGYVRQKISGTFPAYISESYRGFYLNSEPNIFIFNEAASNFLISFTPIALLKRMHLEIFEYVG